MAPRVTNNQLHDKIEIVLTAIGKNGDAIEQNRKDIGSITVCLTGSRDGKEKGLNARVDTLEGSEGTRKKWVGVAVSAAITCVVTLVIAALMRFG